MVIDEFRKDVAVLEFEGKVCVARDCEYVAKMHEMFLRRLWKYDDVVEIYKGKLSFDGR